eukprot:scaffold9946_cov188-Amphora_coffeaeformis.AAC.8
MNEQKERSKKKGTGENEETELSRRSSYFSETTIIIPHNNTNDRLRGFPIGGYNTITTHKRILHGSGSWMQLPITNLHLSGYDLLIKQMPEL